MANTYPKYPKAFIPATECVLAHMPMSGDNKDILIGTSASAYESIVMAHMVSSVNDFSYQRAESLIRYRGNYEDILDSGANYVAWKNTNFGDKVFYAYITELEYRNPNTTWIHIRVDVINTFVYNIPIGTQFVERMTPFDDKIGDNLVPEGFSNLDYVLYDYRMRANLSEYTTLAVVKSPQFSPFNYVYDGIINGLPIYACESGGDVATLIESLDTAGIGVDAEAISMYSIPKVFLSGGSGALPSGTNAAPYDVHLGVNLQSLSFPNQDGTSSGFKPNNWKLYTSPFVSLRLSNGSDAYIDLSFEYFQGNDFHIVILANLIQPVLPIAVPVGYKGSGVDASGKPNVEGNYTLRLGQCPNIGFVSDSFPEFLNAAMLTAGASGISRNAKPTPPMPLFSKVGGRRDADPVLGNLYVETDASLRNRVNYVKSEARTEFNTVAGAIAATLAASENRYEAHNVSASVYNPLIAYGMYGLYAGIKMIPSWIAKQVDDYFSLYGYATNEFVTINLTTNRRSIFNYYKTAECVIRSNIPSEYAREIETIFDSGVRFWYDYDKFGDFSETTLKENSLH